MKLPENIKYKNEDEVLQQATSDFVKNLTSKYKVKPMGDKSGAQVTKDILTLAFASKGEEIELPEDFDHLRKLADHAIAIAKEHREITVEEEESRKAEKEKKAQDKQLAKEEKEREDKQYAESQEKFNAVFERKFVSLEQKTREGVEKALRGLSLPGTIVMAENGMGVVLSDGATKDDIATAAASMISASQGSADMQAALQFVIGDLVNAAVAKKIFRKKGDACTHVKWLIEGKLGRKYSSGNINANSLMAERIPAGRRKMGVLPSLYYFASKVVAPKLKEAKPSEQIEMEKKFDAERDKVIDLINDGKISSNKELTTHVKNFRKEVGIDKDSPDDIRKKTQHFLKRLFFATFVKENLIVDGKATFLAQGVDQGGETVVFEVGEITDIAQEAMNNLQNILLADYNITELLDGKTKVKDSEGKEKTIPYYLEDPFTPKEEIAKTEEPKPAEQEGEADEEAEEEASEGDDETV